MKIFLTGSNGYIGSEFIKAASKKNYIFAVTRKKKNKRIKNVKWLVGSIDKKWHQLKKVMFWFTLQLMEVMKGSQNLKSVIISIL